MFVSRFARVRSSAQVSGTKRPLDPRVVALSVFGAIVLLGILWTAANFGFVALTLKLKGLGEIRSQGQTRVWQHSCFECVNNHIVYILKPGEVASVLDAGCPDEGPCYRKVQVTNGVVGFVRISDNTYQLSRP